jgi:hypothetical protein
MIDKKKHQILSRQITKVLVTSNNVAKFSTSGVLQSKSNVILF